MSNRKTRSFVMMVALASTSVASANAQDPRAPARLDAPSQKAISAVIDSAKAQGIPVKPLYDMVDEGQAKGADGPRIVTAVRRLANDLANAHRALGVTASDDELKAAAAAMHVGVPAVELGKLKKGGRFRSWALPFTVLADIVSRGVPVGAAANALRSLVGAGAKDKDISEFQRDVKEDIQQGAPPAAAAETRAKSTPKPEMDQIQP